MSVETVVHVPAAAPAAAPAIPWTMEVATSFDDVAAARNDWDRCAADAGSVYHSFDHAVAWWRRYGRGRTLQAFVFRSGGTVVGVLPMFVERRRLGPASVRVGALVGSDSTTAVLEPPIPAAEARGMLAAALRHLLVTERCDAVRLGPLAGTWPSADAVLAAAGDLVGVARVASDVEAGPHTVLDLPGSFDAWFASLDKRRRSDHRRALKALGQVCWDVVSDPAALAAELPRFRALHETQWRAEGKLGHFRDWPHAEDFHADLVRVHGTARRAHIVRTVVGGEVVASQLCYGMGRTLHWILPARVLRPDLERLSLGRIGLVQLVEFAIGAGYRRIEAGAGRYEYKLQLGGREHALRTIVVARSSRGTRVRLAAFARLAALLDLAYYRLWFLRVAPRLPLRRRPLRELWIRSRW